MMNNENENVMHDGQNPASEEMDFLAAGKEARRVIGKDSGEWENRSSGTRSRGPSGRYQGLRGRKGKSPVREEDLAGLLKKDAGDSDSELLRALTVDAQPEEATEEALDMAAFLVSSEEPEIDPDADLSEVLMNRKLDRAVEETRSEQSDVQLEESGFEEALSVGFDETVPAQIAEPEDSFDDDDDDDHDDDDDEAAPKRKRRGGLIAAVVAALLCVGVLGSAFAVSRRSTIFPRVSIRGENVSAMTVDEAAAVVEKSGWDGPDAVVLRAELPASVDLEIKARDVGWNATAKEAAQAAFDYGRDGNLITNFINYVRTSFSGHEIGQHCINDIIQQDLMYDDGQPCDPGIPEGITGLIRKYT